LVATVRALKYHGGGDLKALSEPNVEAVAKGVVNLEKHLENLKHYGVQAVVAINQFTSDTDEEIETIVKATGAHGVTAVVANVWGEGGAGAEALARSVAELADNGQSDFHPLYDWSLPVKDKIHKICTTIYGADDVDYTSRAQADLRRVEKLELDGLPVCIAKTQKSLSDNPKLIGRPTGFNVTVREVEIASGAGFLVPITGDIMRMPGLPATPSAELIDIDDEGNISGLF